MYPSYMFPVHIQRTNISSCLFSKMSWKKKDMANQRVNPCPPISEIVCFASLLRNGKKHVEVPCSRSGLSLLSEACLVGLRVALQFHGEWLGRVELGWVG